jgi:hypothetical protein
MTSEVIEWSKIGDDIKITVSFSKGNRSETNTYRGQCTVWHEYPSGKRASLEIEEVLSEYWVLIKWNEDKSLIGKEKITKFNA